MVVSVKDQSNNEVVKIEGSKFPVNSQTLLKYCIEKSKHTVTVSGASTFGWFGGFVSFYLNDVKIKTYSLRTAKEYSTVIDGI